jgi:hypothetical protein
MAVMLSEKYDEAESMVFEYVTNALMDRMPEKEFIQLCEKL